MAAHSSNSQGESHTPVTGRKDERAQINDLSSHLRIPDIEDKIKTEGKQKKEINKIYFLMSSKKKIKIQSRGPNCSNFGHVFYLGEVKTS